MAFVQHQQIQLSSALSFTEKVLNYNNRAALWSLAVVQPVEMCEPQNMYIHILTLSHFCGQTRRIYEFSNSSSKPFGYSRPIATLISSLWWRGSWQRVMARTQVKALPNLVEPIVEINWRCGRGFRALASLLFKTELKCFRTDWLTLIAPTRSTSSVRFSPIQAYLP